jgi:hypothetical protein
VVPLPSVALLTEKIAPQKRKRKHEGKKTKERKRKKKKEEEESEKDEKGEGKRVWGRDKTTHFGALRGFLPSTMQTCPPARHRRQVLSAGSVRTRGCVSDGSWWGRQYERGGRGKRERERD